MSCELMAEHGAALALNSLEAPDREIVEAHARRCRACGRELDELRQVASQLALALPQHDPPAALGSSILAIARSDLERSGAAVAVAPPRRPMSSLSRRPAWLLSITALSLAAVAMVWGFRLQAQLDQLQRQQAETSAALTLARSRYWSIARVLSSPQARVQELQPAALAPAAQSKIWVDPVSGEGMMMARDLPAAPEGQVYQVWLRTGNGQENPAGFLQSNAEGLFYVVLQAPGKISDYQSLRVTREPSGGSPEPSGPGVLTGKI